MVSYGVVLYGGPGWTPGNNFNFESLSKVIKEMIEIPVCKVRTKSSCAMESKQQDLKYTRKIIDSTRRMCYTELAYMNNRDTKIHD